jgi:hypothetical protein
MRGGFLGSRGPSGKAFFQKVAVEKKRLTHRKLTGKTLSGSLSRVLLSK